VAKKNTTLITESDLCWSESDVK